MSTNIVKGKHDQYFWIQCALYIQDTSRHLSMLVQKCPDVLLNSFVIVSSLDSGPLQIDHHQIAAGWQRNGRLALSPRISKTAEVPFEWFDEWFIFDEPIVPIGLEVFVNYGTFSLGDPNPTISTVYIGSDENAIAKMATAVIPMRTRFWTQLERIGSTSYVSNGNCFIFVSRDAELYKRVAGMLESM